MIVHLIPDEGHASVVKPRTSKTLDEVLAFGRSQARSYLLHHPEAHSVEVVVVGSDRVALKHDFVKREGL